MQTHPFSTCRKPSTPDLPLHPEGIAQLFFMALRQLARPLSLGLLTQGLPNTAAVGASWLMGSTNNCAARTVSSTSGVAHAEPQLAAEEAPIMDTTPQAPPRWERELGIIRTDWT